MESLLDDMSVSSIAEEKFTGDPFPGHDRINHSLADLQVIVKQARPDWRIALDNMKGVYVIHGQESGEPYVWVGLWRHRHLAAMVLLRRDPPRRQRRSEEAPSVRVIS